MNPNFDSDASWFLVANRSIAKIYHCPGLGGEYRLVDEVPHPEGRLKEGEINSDRPGRFSNLAPNSAERHATSSPQPAEERVAADFARELIRRLDHSAAMNEFDWLFLVAEPSFLGHLRAALTTQLKRRVAGSLDSDYTHASHDRLTLKLDELMREHARRKLRSRESA